MNVVDLDNPKTTEGIVMNDDIQAKIVYDLILSGYSIIVRWVKKEINEQAGMREKQNSIIEKMTADYLFSWDDHYRKIHCYGYTATSNNPMKIHGRYYTYDVFYNYIIQLKTFSVDFYNFWERTNIFIYPKKWVPSLMTKKEVTIALTRVKKETEVILDKYRIKEIDDSLSSAARKDDKNNLITAGISESNENKINIPLIAGMLGMDEKNIGGLESLKNHMDIVNSFLNDSTKNSTC